MSKRQARTGGKLQTDVRMGPLWSEDGVTYSVRGAIVTVERELAIKDTGELAEWRRMCGRDLLWKRKS